MKILLLSRWGVPIVYDLFSFLHSLENVEVVPCSYGFEINKKFDLQELAALEHHYLNFRQITPSYLEGKCRELRVDILCITWLFEIRELRRVLRKVHLPMLLFPHRVHPLLESLSKQANIYLFGAPWTPQAVDREPGFHFFVSRRFQSEIHEVMDESIFFAGDSNVRMKPGEKKAFQSFIKRYARERRMTVTDNLLFSLFPYRFMTIRRGVQIMKRAFGSDRNLRREMRGKVAGFDDFLTPFRNLPLLDIIPMAPYTQLCAAINRHQFVEVTPSQYCEFLPARATIALASGTPLLLWQGFCPPLEKIIEKYGNGYVYPNHEDLFPLVKNREKVGEMAEQARRHRMMFTLEHFSKEFSHFLEAIQSSK